MTFPIEGWCLLDLPFEGKMSPVIDDWTFVMSFLEVLTIMNMKISR